jgi:hypothetical protein
MCDFFSLKFYLLADTSPASAAGLILKTPFDDVLFCLFDLLFKMENLRRGILVLSQLMVSVFISQRRHELSYMHVDRSMMIRFKQ